MFREYGKVLNPILPQTGGGSANICIISQAHFSWIIYPYEEGKEGKRTLSWWFIILIFGPRRSLILSL